MVLCQAGFPSERKLDDFQMFFEDLGGEVASRKVFENVLHGFEGLGQGGFISEKKLKGFRKSSLKIWAKEVFSRKRFGWFLECFDAGLGWRSFLSEWVLEGLCKDYLKYWAGEI